MRFLSILAATFAIILCWTMAGGIISGDSPAATHSIVQAWTPVMPDVEDSPPIETNAQAAVLVYVGCDPDACRQQAPLATQTIVKRNNIPGTFTSAPSSLKTTETKPYFDNHVDGSHRLLIGFLMIDQPVYYHISGVIRMNNHSYRIAEPGETNWAPAIYVRTSGPDLESSK